jgi:hypothetical protein
MPQPPSSHQLNKPSTLQTTKNFINTNVRTYILEIPVQAWTDSDFSRRLRFPKIKKTRSRRW